MYFNRIVAEKLWIDLIFSRDSMSVSNSSWLGLGLGLEHSAHACYNIQYIVDQIQYIITLQTEVKTYSTGAWITLPHAHSLWTVNDTFWGTFLIVQRQVGSTKNNNPLVDQQHINNSKKTYRIYGFKWDTVYHE